MAGQYTPEQQAAVIQRVRPRVPRNPSLAIRVRQNLREQGKIVHRGAETVAHWLGQILS